MQYKLRKENKKEYSTIEQILTNRGIPISEINHYLNTSDQDINPPEAFGEILLEQGLKMLIKNITQETNLLVICDCDCDGFTSAALLINYLHQLFPAYIENHLKWFVHEDKQHGLSDAMDYINQKNFGIIIVPDAGSNDLECHKILRKKGIDILVLDHHLTDEISEDAIVINNQICNYENKDLSGVGVVWQFCRYIDEKLKTNYANQYLDLVALGLTGDMMSLTSFETKHLVNKGFEPENIKNPYIYEMWQKNSFKLGDHINSIDAAFYIVPMINAVQRSGTIEEKELLFKSMLNYEAFNMIPSNKRGHAVGELERVVDQAVRMSTNVKNRQTRVQDNGLEYLENLIEKEHKLNHKVLLFLLEPNKVDKNVAGLIANKFAAKYQRPCCILTKTLSENNEILYQGSARGYEISGITNFKDLCENTAEIEWTAGHQNAFGLCLKEDKVLNFLDKIDIELSGMSVEPLYYVDYIYNGVDVNPQDILTIGNLKNLWGKDMDEALVAIKDLKVDSGMVTIYRKTSNTIKITLPNKVNLMKFNASEEECMMLEERVTGYVQFDIVGTCHINEWLGNVSPQIFIEDYEITGSGKFLF